MKFHGIADANGLESFEPIGFDAETGRFKADLREISMMVLRARANRHRYAVVFEADVPTEPAREIKSLMKEGEYEQALLKLKESTTKIKIAQFIDGREDWSKKAWSMIPNPNLDPYK